MSAQTCAISSTTIDTFTQTARSTARRGSKLKIVLKINMATDQIEFDYTGLKLEVTLPPQLQYLKSSLTALPDRLVGPKGTKQARHGFD